MKLVTSDEMRALEQAAVAAGVSEQQLMEEAGLGVAQEAWMQLGTLEGRRIAILVGPGNNGGDGIVAARHLFDWGADVALILPRARRDMTLIDELEPREIPVVVADSDDGREQAATMIGAAELIIDALLGIGQKRPLDPEEPISAALVQLRAARASVLPPKLLAVDLPTGVDADTGAVDPLAVAPDLTVTFGLPKIGMYQLPASEMVGNVQVIEISVPKEAQEQVPMELLTAKWARSALPARPIDGNKGTFGRLLVVGGSRRFMGAPQLVALGAYRAGAGLVSVGCPEGLVASVVAGVPEATFLPLETSAEGGIASGSVPGLRNRWKDFDAAVIGPGMGNDGETSAFLWAALGDLAYSLPNGFVIDADGLNAIAAMPDGSDRVPPQAVLTPHPGEMARLLGTSTAEVQAQRLDSARTAAQRYGCTVVLKGAHTVIAAADGRVRLSPYANPLLATAGSGDVLAGIIGGYIAQGLDPFTSACLGVYVHAATGEALRQEYGESGLLSREIATRLPGVVREVRRP